jgi:hypothetical protein
MDNTPSLFSLPASPPTEPETVADVERLARDLARLKQIETDCKLARTLTEAALAKAIGFSRQEGQQTFKTGFGAKITCKAGLNRKLDLVKWHAEIKAHFPPEYQAVVKTVEELDETGVKWLEKNKPDVYAMLAPALTVTPAKVAVSVEFAELKEAA